MILISSLLGLAWYAQPDGRLHVIFLNTSGDAELVQTPGGSYILIDGGNDPTAVAAALGQRLPFWRRTLAAVVLTAPEQRRVAGQLAALARYQASMALAPKFTAHNAMLDEWQRLLRTSATALHTARTGQRLVIDGVALRVLAAGDGADAGMLLRLEYGSTSVVLCQSSAAVDEEALATQGALRGATLVAFPWQRDPHTATLAALHPRAVVLTDGFVADQPIEETMVDRKVGNEALYHEKLNGTIEWISTGATSWIVTDQS